MCKRSVECLRVPRPEAALPSSSQTLDSVTGEQYGMATEPSRRSCREDSESAYAQSAQGYSRHQRPPVLSGAPTEWGRKTMNRYLRGALDRVTMCLLITSAVSAQLLRGPLSHSKVFWFGRSVYTSLHYEENGREGLVKK